MVGVSRVHTIGDKKRTQTDSTQTIHVDGIVTYIYSVYDLNIGNSNYFINRWSGVEDVHVCKSSNDLFYDYPEELRVLKHRFDLLLRR